MSKNNTETMTLSHKIAITPWFPNIKSCGECGNKNEKTITKSSWKCEKCGNIHEIEDWKNVRMILRDIQDDVNRVLNSSVFINWAYDSRSNIAKDMLDEKITIKDIDENAPSLVTYMNRKNKTKFTNANGEVIEQTAREARVKYDKYKEDMKLNKGFIPNFGSNAPIPIKNTAFKLEKIGSNYIMSARLLSEDYANELHKGIKYSYKVGGKGRKVEYNRPVSDRRMSFKLVVKDKKTKEILDKCITGQYKQGSSKLLKKIKGKWQFSLSYTFERKVISGLNEDNIMGIDMGVVYPVYMAFNNSLDRYNISGGEIDHFRKGIQSRRNALLRQGKYCGKGRRGHGVKTRTKPIEKLQNRVDDFKKTTNHKYSKYVVDIAIKHGCGTIQMEDLTGIADGEKKGTFLGNWTYYDLQEKITYKAERVGIKVVKVKPNYTSQRCSKCGCINKENRDAKKDQAKFECVKCGFKTNADYNAAKNIAEKDIEWIIEEQLNSMKQGSYIQR